MPWIIETAFSEPGRLVNEDACGAAGSLAWIFDGAGLGVQSRFPGYATDAAWLVATAGIWLEQHGAMAGTLADLLERLQQHLMAAFGAPDTTEPSGGPSACLVLARLHPDRQRIDLAWIADTVALVPQPDGTISIVTDDRVAAFEALTFAAMRGMARINGDLPPAAREQIRRNRARVNQPAGYAVVSPARPWTSLVRYATVDFDPSKPVVLMSDGVSRLFDTFAAVTADQLHAICAAGNGMTLIAQVRALERADPDAMRFTRFKIHDDATLIAVRAKE